MTIRRRVYKRTRTIEEISVLPGQQFTAYRTPEGERFRIEVFDERDESIYVAEIIGKFELQELPNGEFQIKAGTFVQIRRGEKR